jgi:hypothetical protein
VAALPGKNVKEVTLGLGVLSLNAIDVGFLKGDVNLSLSREIKDFEAGVPLLVQKRVCIREKMMLRAGLAQMYADKFQYALGGGVVDYPSGSQARFQFGADPSAQEYTLAFHHAVPNSIATVDVYMYRASPTIAVEVPFREEEFTVFNAEWGALANLAKDAGTQYGYVLFTGFEGS